jgi:hypothetical protein
MKIGFGMVAAASQPAPPIKFGHAAAARDNGPFAASGAFPQFLPLPPDEPDCAPR